MQFTLRCLAYMCISTFVLLEIHANYIIPDVKIQAVRPQGIHVSLPNEEGVRFFEFHANVNEDISEKDLGNIFIRVSAPVPDPSLWQFIDRSVKLNAGDVLNYWLLVWYNGEKYTRHGLSFKVEEFNEVNL